MAGCKQPNSAVRVVTDITVRSAPILEFDSFRCALNQSWGVVVCP